MNFRRKIAIDLGTTNVLVYSRNKGVMLKEPSIVAIDRFTDKIVAVGDDAKKMLGRTPGNIVPVRAMKDGVIVDYASTERMLKYFMKKSLGRALIKPDVVICVPSGATQVQKRAVIQAATKAGANDVFLIEEPLAAAIGAGIDIADPGGNMIIDIGGGTTDVAVISLGGIVVSESVKVAGDSCDQAIASYIREKYDVVIGESTAEEIKISLNDAENSQMVSVRGRDLSNGLPAEVLVTPLDIERALEAPINKIIGTIKRVLSNTPPELAADLYASGAILTGGGSLIKGLDKKIKEEIGIDVIVSENPISAVVRGTGKSLNWIERLDSIENNQYDIVRRQIARREELRRR